MRSSDKVKKALDQFVAVSIGPRGGDAKKVGKIKYIPLLVFYNSKGKEVERKVGYQKADQLAKYLNSMAKKASK